MNTLKALPVKVETAIAQALRAVRDAGGDDLTLRAFTQRLEADLEHHGFAVRPGFRYVSNAVVDLSGKDRFAELWARTNERLGDESLAAAGMTREQAGGEFPIAGAR